MRITAPTNSTRVLLAGRSTATKQKLIKKTRRRKKIFDRISVQT